MFTHKPSASPLSLRLLSLRWKMAKRLIISLSLLLLLSAQFLERLPFLPMDVSVPSAVTIASAESWKLCEEGDPLCTVAMSTEPKRYPIAPGACTPLIANPDGYGPCEEGPANRPACAVQAYTKVLKDHASKQQGKQSCLKWDDFFLMTFAGEAGTTIYIPAGPCKLGENGKCAQGSRAELYCNIGVSPAPNLKLGMERAQPVRPNTDYRAFEAGCETVRILFEEITIGQLVQACGGNSCTEADFVKYLGGVNGLELGQQAFGLQAWYGAADFGYGKIVENFYIRLNPVRLRHYPGVWVRLQKWLKDPCTARSGNWGEKDPPRTNTWAKSTAGTFELRVAHRFC